MEVEINSTMYKCHCPATGRIGDIIFKDIPCLLSKGNNEKRKTPYTVEAISLDALASSKKTWIGINQNAVNRYIEHFLKTGQLENIVSNGHSVIREQKLGSSRLDFLVENTYLEVKTPLSELPHGQNISYKSHSEFNSFDRLIKHICELSRSLNINERAVLLNCFIYNSPRFKIPKRTSRNIEIIETVRKAIRNGVEIWQVNMEITPEKVDLINYFEITMDFVNI
jgi:sugar fermentation stimulation protein A